MPDFAKLAAASTIARGLAMDAVHTSASGHLGLPLGAAEIGAVLFGDLLSVDPADPTWLNRDRFVLSAGHGSMFLYAWLHLSGYAISLDEVKRFRQWGAITPGHPEFHETPGVEATTGPLGQGVGNAVGHALSAKMAAARFNTAEHAIFDHYIWALAGDGCLQEGIAAEAASFAGHFKLDNLVLIYDSNDVTLDAMANKSQSEDTAKRFEAYGWEVLHIEKGNDLEEIHAVLSKARASTSGKPKFVVARTLIGKGIPEVAGTAKAHGEGGAKFIDAARKALGLPAEHFFVSDEVKSYFAAHKAALGEKHAAWKKTYDAWRAANPALAAELDNATKKAIPADLSAKIPAFAADSKLATRKAGEAALQAVAAEVPSLIGGSADLYGSTFNYIASSTDWDPEHRAGRNIRFGIREHAMGAILNGVAYHGIFRPSGSTFLVFADYLRPSIRIAALAHLPVIYIFTHDSIGVGEDGPTHQPVETVMGLRVIPNLDVQRPADPEETAGSWAAATLRTDGPTVLALSRQALPMLNQVDAATRREGAARGAYVLIKETAPLQLILLASGSEVQHMVAAAAELGPGVRVVSVPSFFRFDRQDAAYRESVLPASCTKRISLEAGVTLGWDRYTLNHDNCLGIDRFGASAPGPR
ncbi:MAG: transketolase [Polyangiaceae bacterium]